MVDVLKDLHDIHLPTPISMWPTAPGYLILAILLLIICALFFVSFYYRKTRQIKRIALQELAKIEQAYKTQEQAPLLAGHISSLLKQVALLYYPRDTIASLQGDAWLDFLTTSSKRLDFKAVKYELLELPFQPESKQSLIPLFILTKRWIKQRGARCLN